MITIIDSTQRVKYNNQKSYNDLLKSVNATVNHELRNPLNSIVAFNMQKEALYEQLEIVISDENLEPKDKKAKLQKIIDELKEGNQVQKSSAKII